MPREIADMPIFQFHQGSCRIFLYLVTTRHTHVYSEIRSLQDEILEDREMFLEIMEMN